MRIEFVPVKCPACNASVDVDSNLSTAYCSYCGNKLIVKNPYKTEHYRKEDKHVYIHNDVQNSKEYYKYKKAEEEQKTERFRMKMAMATLGIMILMLLLLQCGF